MKKKPLFKGTNIQRAAAACLRADVVPALIGDPGLGKTSMVEAWAERWGYQSHTILIAAHQAGEFTGWPSEDADGEFVFKPMKFVRDVARHCAAGGKSLLHYDEFLTASPAQQVPALRTFAEGYIGDVKLPEQARLIVSFNHPENGIGGWSLPAPMSNRLVQLRFPLDIEGWLDGLLHDFDPDMLDIPSMDELCAPREKVAAQRASLYGAIAGFAKSNPQAIHSCPADADDQSQPWPSLRTWTYALNTLSHVHADDEVVQKMILDGLVGEASSTAFFTYMRERDLPSITELLDRPDDPKWGFAGMRSDRVFISLNGVVSYVAKLPEAERTAAWESAAALVQAVSDAGKPDVAQIALEKLFPLKPERAVVPPGLLEAFKDFFTALNAWVTHT